MSNERKKKDEEGEEEEKDEQRDDNSFLSMTEAEVSRSRFVDASRKTLRFLSHFLLRSRDLGDRRSRVFGVGVAAVRVS